MKRIVIHSNHTQEHSSSSVGWTSNTLFFLFQPKQDPISLSFFLLLSSLLIFLPISSFRILFFSPHIWPPLPQNLFLNFVLYFFSFSHLSKSPSFSLKNILPSSLKPVSSNSYQTPPMSLHLFSFLLRLPLSAIFHGLLRKHQPHLFLFPSSHSFHSTCWLLNFLFNFFFYATTWLLCLFICLFFLFFIYFFLLLLLLLLLVNNIRK